MKTKEIKKRFEKQTKELNKLKSRQTRLEKKLEKAGVIEPKAKKAATPPADEEE